jgi:hypothetical protein
MTNQHPITLPPAILQKLRSTAPTSGWHRDAWIAEQAAQWGADQELEACCEWVTRSTLGSGTCLRAARRPKPLSDKELALNALSLIMSQQKGMFDGKPFDTIRRALEALPE